MMGRGKKRGSAVAPTAARAAHSPYRGRPSASSYAARAKEPTRDFIEHATILKKLFPRAGEPERDTGWTIAKARNEANGETVTLIGTYGPVEEGQLIAIKNDLKKDPPWQDGRYGAEYKVWALDHGDSILATRAGLKSYLDNLPGVGDKLSDAIINTFQGNGHFDGAAILAHIDEDPTRLNQVRGAHGHAIRADLDELVKKWAELREERKEMLFLGSLEIGHSTANRIRKHFRELGIDPVAAIKHDPYVLVEVDGVGFRIADAAAKSRGVAFDDPRRLVAGLNYVLDEAKDRDSHICLTREQLIQKAPYTLTRDHRRPSAALIGKAIDDAVAQGRLVSYTDATDGVERIYTTQMYLVETRLYEQLNRLLSHEKLELPSGFETARPNTSPLTEEQWTATVNCFHEKISILTGGPGTGKCLRGDVKVLVNGALVPIEDVWAAQASEPYFDGEGWWTELKEPVLTVSVDSEGRLASGVVTRLYRQQVDEMGRTVRLANGSHITMTKRHRLLGLGGWQRELSVGDWVALPQRVEWDGKPVDMDLVTLLAWQIAEGCEYPNTVKIFQAERSVLERLGAAATRWSARVGVEMNSCPINEYPSGGTPRLDISSAAYRDWLVAQGYRWGQKSAAKQIPDFIVAGDDETVRLFLREYAAAEGHVQSRDGVLEITSASRDVVDSLCLMARRFGIYMRVHRKRKMATNGKRIKRTYWTAYVGGESLRVWRDRIGIADACKEADLALCCQRKTNPNLEVVPARDLLAGLRSLTGLGRKALKMTSSYLSGQRDVSRQKAALIITHLEALLDGSYALELAKVTGRGRGNYHRVINQLQALPRQELTDIKEELVARAAREVFYTKITSVEDVELKGWVYDLEVAEHHNYVANGIISHNTTSLRTMLEELDKQGHKYLCLAPTGKAAKRMSESTGRPASTIHRALGVVGGLTPPRSMTEEPRERLDVDVVVVDEVSMLDAELAERLLSHLHDRTRIVFVGDPDQLPPVGPGSVLLDLIEADRVPTAKLTQVFRQAEGSLLVVNAHRIKDGLEPFWSKAEAEAALGHPVKEDFVVLEVGSASAARDTVIAQVDAISNEIGVSPKEVLVCAPFRKGEAGVWKLNSILQDRHNPRGEQIRGGEEKPLRVNDIVMNTSNRYARRDQEDEYDVMNGDMGRIESWDPEKKLALIDFGEGEMKFQGDDLDKVVPAYAATIHKLQGSQGPGLVLPLTGGQASSLISRNHVYTGMTRAEEKCVMVVDDKKTLLEVLSRQFKRETTLDLRVGRIEKRLKAAWEQVRDFESKWQEHLKNRDLPKLSRPSSLAG